MWATSVPILVFLGLSVIKLGPMYTTDVRQKHRLMPPPYGDGGITRSVGKWPSRYGLYITAVDEFIVGS